MSAEVDDVEEELRYCTSSIQIDFDGEKSIRSVITYDSEHSIPSRPSSVIHEYFDPNYDTTATWIEDDSPYPEVRSAVANFDDPNMPVATLRSWLFGIMWAILLPGINQFYYFRYPSLTVTGIVAQLLTFPLGRLWARFVPRIKVFGLSLNPGPFNIKEHVLVTIMAGVAAQTAYATDVVAVQRVWYHQRPNFIYQWMLVISTQLIGFSVGGLARRMLVEPPSMIWPNTLVSCALFNTLHSQSYAGIGGRDGISRERFFAYAFITAMLWYLFPGYLFQALSTFTWGCWIAPNNRTVNTLFGYHSGLGFSLLTFDWNQISFIGSPLATPWWAEANIIAGFLFFYWFLAPILYFCNVWYSQYMPISSLSPYDNQGNTYNLTRVLNADSTFNVTSYGSYSPLYLPMNYAIAYGLSFASITALIVHSVLYFGRPIAAQLRRRASDQTDIHQRLMSVYSKVPEWWYACILLVTFLFGCLCIKLWPTEMTIWAFVIALLIALVYIVPTGMIQAVTNQQLGINVISELIIGYMLPGRPIALMMFKTWAYITMAQAMIFTADMKLGHYMKIPPRSMFWAQVVATIVAGTVQLGVQSWMFTNIPDLCLQAQHEMTGFTCPNTEVFGTASVVWGVIGPSRQFSRGRLYQSLLYFFIVGAACPLIVWGFSFKYPNSFLNYVNFPLIFAGLGVAPPATAVNYVPWAIIGFIFHLQYPDNGNIGLTTIQQWWGNTVFKNTADWNSSALRPLLGDERFGLEEW
ncbi:OPT oligopeptide transporter [Sparassis latifolia]